MECPSTRAPHSRGSISLYLLLAEQKFKDIRIVPPAFRSQLSAHAIRETSPAGSPGRLFFLLQTPKEETFTGIGTRRDQPYLRDLFKDDRILLTIEPDPCSITRDPIFPNSTRTSPTLRSLRFGSCYYAYIQFPGWCRCSYRPTDVRRPRWSSDDAGRGQRRGFQHE